ncbi:PREDICTED: mitogen-activated protein kinase kinase kinase NPK1-like [Nelumbo nucifera]|uniref:Mitogen-activated protein kinase kinase kinase NPK1-like n=1 Tax=Nelumbo nucifera TaxID=4432 RepID=A0A1U7ZF82_NELNU|nr:PREDICTED: mitogen-activated protein kinase kinase kinase NPK1-like [Nelumbo nucifera]
MAGKCSQPREWIKGNVIGSGSFGVVNLAINKATGGIFVVKSASSGAGVQSLENEANILELLDSPYIVRCLGRDFSTGANGERKLNLFLEYMAGGSLADLAQKFGGALDETVIQVYTREILQGLSYLHRRGIVHNDLKCKNVLLGPTGNIKLADFGCAKRLNSSQAGSKVSQQSICGTPLWMAPEVLRNEGLDTASDIWSLGCSIIEMATGRPPWADEVSNPMALLLKIACSSGVPQFPTNFSKEGLDFLAKCLQRDPKLRWTSEELLNHPFITRKNVMAPYEEDACSPTSILDVQLNEEDSDSDCDSEPLHNEELSSKVPFSTRYNRFRGRLTRKQQREYDLHSNEKWITVR